MSYTASEGKMWVGMPIVVIAWHWRVSVSSLRQCFMLRSASALSAGLHSQVDQCAPVCLHLYSDHQARLDQGVIILEQIWRRGCV